METTINKYKKLFLLAGFVTTISFTMLSSVVFAANDVARIGNVTYQSLAEAVSAAKLNDIIILEQNTNECIIIPKTANITIDLNGKQLVNNADCHTIENKGTLILESTEPSGIVDNIVDNKAAIFNDVGANATINGGLTLNKSNDNSTESLSWYTVANRGIMTINNGVTVINPGTYTSAVSNGFLDVANYFPDVPYVSLTINGGSLFGGKNTIKNDSGGYLTVNNGTTITNYSSNPAILNWNVATINDAIITADNVFSIGKYNRTGSLVPNIPTEKGEITINGGTFTGQTIFNYAKSSNSQAYKIIINNGTFTGDLGAAVSSEATFAVNGGEFSNTPPNYVDIPYDKEVVQNKNGYYIIKDKPKIIYDLNGGTSNSSLVPIPVNTGFKFVAPTWSEINSYISAPYGKVYIGVEVNGKRLAIGDAYNITENVAVKLLWEDKYKIIEGANQIYAINSNSNIMIKANGDLSNLVAIKVNDKVLDKANYKLASGSTILTLKSSYLNTLAAGKYTIGFVYNDGIVNTQLTIIGRTLNSPNTGANTNNIGTTTGTYIMSAVVSAFFVSILFGLFYIIKKQNT